MALGSERIFKTAWFAKASKKARITDAELCSAVRQVMLGQVDDLGGGVFKKRIGKNLYRSLILAKGRQYWVYAIAPAQIKLIRENQQVSQPVFARYLNTSESTVEKWEAGVKRPSGMALKLLMIVQKHGLKMLV